ncbi:transketolase [Rhodococcus sp. D2-41]|uniref:Transketolase n=1 Tax=Speluncibacter jeojiensis TaxID=2710754 RepID=A0A9X4RHT9_9ACTN|nr:transketolase C-terminal domain-containing protein [Rhodococcus sp. D2-41]MDG3008945.1 transketolase [Rhodococcus sp. D2-41]MDG3015456.1 transketolase [Corynebacteriales bacterium D3-21]
MSATTNRSNAMEDVFSDEGQASSLNMIGRALADLADRHPDVVVLSADLGSALSDLKQRHPSRYIELGIAETNTISVAAGMAASGFRPYVLAFAPFGMIKCAEQIRTDLAATMMPVTLVTRLSGLAMGYFGASHHAVEDLAIARAITNLTVMAPADNAATVALLEQSHDEPGPVLLRVSEATRPVYPAAPILQRGRFGRVRDGRDLTIIGTGAGVGCAVAAAGVLEDNGIHAAVLDAAYLKPLDDDAILAAARATGAILTVEEHNVVGGLGSAVAEVLGRHRVAIPFASVALPDEDLEVGVPADLLSHYGITPEGVAREALSLLSR